jgi:hypothetical protein
MRASCENNMTPACCVLDGRSGSKTAQAGTWVEGKIRAELPTVPLACFQEAGAREQALVNGDTGACLTLTGVYDEPPAQRRTSGWPGARAAGPPPGDAHRPRQRPSARPAVATRSREEPQSLKRRP